jgi:dienelactone hydrolase
MKQYFLTECIGKDDVIHQGVYFEPIEKSDVAILYIHGLSSHFSSHIATCDGFVEMGEKMHIGFASFNNRGFGLISGPQKKDPTALTGFTHIRGGAGQEVFEECVLDIDAGLTFLTKQGYTKIVLVGRSTGANKACFYAGTVDDPRVIGVVLNSAVSDRLEKTKEDIAATLPVMKKRIAEGKGDELLTGYSFFPMTAKRYVSLYEQGSKEDVFDYGDEAPKMKTYSKITKPLFVVFGGSDEHADRPVADIVRVFDEKTTSQKYKSIIVPNALHGFEGKEQDLANLIGEWITSL